MSTLSIYLMSLILVMASAAFGILSFYLWLSYLLEKNPKSSVKYLFYAVLLFIPAPLWVVIVINKLSLETPLTLVNTPAIVIFMVSSFFGLSIFLLFVHSLFEKKVKSVLVTLFMGSVVFLFFAPSAYFTFTPFVKDYYVSKTKKAESYLADCNEKKSDYHCEQIAQMYIDGEGVEQDYAKAIAMYQKASDNNMSFSTYALGEIYEKGEITKRDVLKSTQYYKRACDSGYSTGCIKLADSYYKGRGIEQNVLKAEAMFFNYCIGGEEKSCSYYLDIHGAKSLMSYSTDKEFDGRLVDDPSNWSRAFGTAQPENITILKSLFKSSYSYCCTRYSYYFKIAMSDNDRTIALSELEEVNEIPEKDIFPENFLEEKALKNYKIYKDRGVALWVNTKTHHIYIQYDGYIDGR